MAIAARVGTMSRALRAGGRLPPGGWLGLLLVMAPFAAAYVAAALVMPLPTTYVPDESWYAHLARLWAHGDGFEWRGSSVPLRSALYVYLIAPAWKVAGGVAAYQVAKVITAVLSLLVAVPVYATARAVVGPRLALAAGALSLAGTWMSGGQLMTESIGLPLATAALACGVLGLQRGSRRLTVVALVLAVLAGWSRAQLLALVPILLLAMVLDVARGGRDWRSRWRLHRPLLVATGLIVVVAVVVAVVWGASAFFGTYAGVVSDRPSFSVVLRQSWSELLELGAACAFAPLALLVALAGRRRAWLDPAVGPMLAVLVPATLVLVGQAGFYLATLPDPWPIQRYVTYVAPLLLVLALAAVARRPLAGRGTFVAVVVLSAAAGWLPASNELRLSEEQATYGIETWARRLAPHLSTGHAAQVISVTIATLAGLTAWRSRHRGPALAPAVLAGILLAVLAAQSVSYFPKEIRNADGLRDELPARLDWVDRAAGGPVAALAVDSPELSWPLVDLFNERIDRFYATDVAAGSQYVSGGTCSWKIGAGGLVELGCRPASDTFLLVDSRQRLTFYDEVSSRRAPGIGRLVRIRPPVRVQAITSSGCAPGTSGDSVTPGCRPVLDVALWLFHPETLELTLRGGPINTYTVVAGNQQHLVPPGRVTRIRLPVAAGDGTQLEVLFNWDLGDAGAPRFSRADLLESGGRRLVYRGSSG